MKTLIWFITALVLGAALMYVYFTRYYVPRQTIMHRQDKNFDVLTLKLPRSPDADIFGPEYWKVKEYIQNLIPCSVCRNDAVPFGSFEHDFVNLKTGKTLYDQNNWKEHVKKINELNAKVA